MPFFQDPPRLGNQYRGDRVLRSLLARMLPEGVIRWLAATGQLPAS